MINNLTLFVNCFAAGLNFLAFLYFGSYEFLALTGVSLGLIYASYDLGAER